MSKFDKAFAEARKAGKKEFSYNGKKYNTKLKEETKSSLPKTAPVPSKRSDNITTKSKEPSFSGLNNVAMKSMPMASAKAKATGKRSPFSPTHDRGASGVAEMDKMMSPSARGKGMAKKSEGTVTGLRLGTRTKYKRY